MAIPSKFSYLLAPDMPRVIQECNKLHGTWEWRGSEHNPVILNMAKALGISKIYTNDEVAWCALAAAFVLMRTGKHVPYKGYELLRAKSFVTFGQKAVKPMLGDVIVYDRDGGGHVNFYVGETPTTFFGYGGNQGNQFNITEIRKERAIAFRRPFYTNQPETVRAIALNSSGVISSNEA